MSLFQIDGKPGTIPRTCSGKFITTENVVNHLLDRGLTQAGTINLLSNEDTGKYACFELAPGFFIVLKQPQKSVK
jgi:hypothetical protein